MTKTECMEDPIFGKETIECRYARGLYQTFLAVEALQMPLAKLREEVEDLRDRSLETPLHVDDPLAYVRLITYADIYIKRLGVRKK